MNKELIVLLAAMAGAAALGLALRLYIRRRQKETRRMWEDYFKKTAFMKTQVDYDDYRRAALRSSVPNNTARVNGDFWDFIMRDASETNNRTENLRAQTENLHELNRRMERRTKELRTEALLLKKTRRDLERRMSRSESCGQAARTGSCGQESRSENYGLGIRTENRRVESRLAVANCAGEQDRYGA